MKYKDKRSLFYKAGMENDILQFTDNKINYSIAQRVVISALKFKLFFPAYSVFYVKELLSRKH